ncbi:serine/threonine-protein kinase [Streptomyces pakalii]|uniref:non-specific serine/threonine protein kinase n=1 Tax=Streptomyces pakalii TaxID=3036494 RepID=A0ABT7D0H9_9ACTN|nr:serine/threonine-protein kinase [Streptomyces pakalii]MDJ1639301.1 serine/threonine-protein kinase [Streptomyces pakalii]
MTDHGGRADEPTSYQLRPPQPPVPPAQVPAPTVAATAADADPGVGRSVGGRYRLLSRLGHGGMGTVWRAHDEVIDREVAVKEPRVPEHLGESGRNNVHARMKREALAAARIVHPSVVTIHDVVFEDGRPWIVMELVSGRSLGDRLQEGTLDPREAARIGLAVLDALEAVHAETILHRDVKPDNILLGSGDRVVLTDFGIAYVEGEQRLTETGAFVGSPEYISPERVLGREPGPASDLWSLGIVLYAAVEGVSPFRRSHTPGTLQAVLDSEPHVLSPQRSGGLGPLVMQLLRKDPAQRPPAAEVRRVLQQIAAPPPPPAPTIPVHHDAADGVTGWRRWLLPPALHGNRPAQLAVGGGVLAVVLALVLILVDPFQGDGPPEGWLVRTETEVLAADVAVPGDYKRAEGDEADMVTYADPSGVFEITFWHRVAEAADESPGADAKARRADYEKGGENTTSMEDAVVEDHGLTYQGRAATEMDTEYTPYGATEDDPVRYRFLELLIPGEKKTDPYWHVRVKTPAAGQARTDGAAIFDEVKAHFKIRGS